MDFFELFDSLVDDILFVLWWIVPIKFFNVDLSWLKAIPYKYLIIMWLGVISVGGIVRAVEAMK